MMMMNILIINKRNNKKMNNKIKRNKNQNK